MPEKPYDHSQIELKWHERWENADFYKAEENSAKPKFYVLEMLPYPSGTLHIGHIRNYSIGDALARYKWMRGYNVLHPMGWDAFGLPAENAAIANQRPPREWTLQNIAAMKKTHRRFGFSYDWDREVSTCEPEYYRWNQWFFLKMLERGLAYRKKALVNWCPRCATVLANEQVVEGCCWRHEDTPVEQRALEQWFLKITAYADQLLDDMAGLEGGWPERVLTMQRNWIGRSEGAEIDFTLAETRRAHPRLHHPRRHHLRRHLRDPGARAPAHRAPARRRRPGPRQSHGGCARGARSGRYRKGRLLHRPLRRQPVQRRTESPSGSPISCSWDTEPAPSWRFPRTMSAISNSAASTAFRSAR